MLSMLSANLSQSPRGQELTQLTMLLFPRETQI